MQALPELPPSPRKPPRGVWLSGRQHFCLGTLLTPPPYWLGPGGELRCQLGIGTRGHFQGPCWAGCFLISILNLSGAEKATRQSALGAYPKMHHHFGTEAPRRLGVGGRPSGAAAAAGSAAGWGMGAVAPTRCWVEQALALAAVFSAALLSPPATRPLPCLVSRVSSPGCSAQCLLWACSSAGVLPSRVRSSHSCCPVLCSELSFPIWMPALPHGAWGRFPRCWDGEAKPPSLIDLMDTGWGRGDLL